MNIEVIAQSAVLCTFGTHIYKKMLMVSRNWRYGLYKWFQGWKKYTERLHKSSLHTEVCKVTFPAASLGSENAES